MAQQSTPIHNITDNNANNEPAINETNLSTAQQILQKYNEMDTGDADSDRQQVNGNMQNRQMDPNMQQQQRLAELERNQQMQMQMQMQMQKQKQEKQENQNNNSVSGILNNLNKIIQKSQDKLKDVIVVVFLFITLNLNVVNKLLISHIPFISTDGVLNINGVISKGVIAGIVFFIISTLLLVL
jgi:hypothetical protein